MIAIAGVAVLVMALALAFVAGWVVSSRTAHPAVPVPYNPLICDGCTHHRAYHFYYSGRPTYCGKGLCDCLMFQEPPKPPEPPEPPPDLSWVRDLNKEVKKDQR